MEVVHEGFLEKLITESSNKKQYKKYYFVFKREASSGTKTLEYFKDSNWKKNEPKGVCNVYSGYSVNIISQSKKKMLFELVTIDKTYELLAATEQIGTTWVNILNDGLFISTFRVTLVQFPPGAKHLMRNFPTNAQLKVSDCSVCLLGYGCPSVTWRFSAIRKYKLHNGNVVLEVGTRAMTGEGEFRFDTSDPKLVYETIDKAIKNRIKVKGISTEKVEHKTPPPVLPMLPEVDNSASARQKIFQKNRSQSQGPLSHPPSPTAHTPSPTPTSDDSYDHLDSIRNNVNTTVNENDTYDKLNNSFNAGQKRHSEPSISNDSFLSSSNRPVINPESVLSNHRTNINTESFLANNRALTGKTVLPSVSPLKQSNSFDQQEDYVMMDDNVDVTSQTTPPMLPLQKINESKESKKVALIPPKPPPRVKPKDDAKDKSNFSVTVEKTVDDTYDHPNNVPRNAKFPVETVQNRPVTLGKTVDDTYDHPNNIPRHMNLPIETGQSDYNHLFEQNNQHNVKQTPPEPRSIVQEMKNLNTQNNPAKKKNKDPILPKGAFVKPVKNTMHSPLKPTRPAPKPPSIADSPKGEAVSQPLYDIPKSNPSSNSCEYNQVGDIIAGEYRPSRLEDDEGYVAVPQTDSNAIYQVPRE